MNEWMSFSYLLNSSKISHETADIEFHVEFHWLFPPLRLCTISRVESNLEENNNKKGHSHCLGLAAENSESEMLKTSKPTQSTWK